MSSAHAAPESPTRSSGSTFSSRILHVSWMAILLGFVLELVLLVIANVYTDVKDLKPFVADLVQKVSWAGMVCVALAVGVAASKLQSAAMGLLGLLGAPVAFLVARALHRGANHALGLPDLQVSRIDPLVIGLIKGGEYAALGLLIGWLGRRSLGGFFIYVGSGLAVGIIFGGYLLYRLEPPWPARFLSIAANELIFPVGCALTLFAAESLVSKPAPSLVSMATRSRETHRGPMSLYREEPKS